MKNSCYRLEQYKILAKPDGSLWWETHVGFAGARTGKCLITSNILFLGPAIETEAPGYLMLEYSESLNALPLWTNTDWYCTNYVLRACDNDRTLTLNQIYRKHQAVPETAMPSVYRVGGYQLTLTEEGELFWHKPIHLSRLSTGKAFIIGNILFLDGRDKKVVPGYPRQEFLKHLGSLQRWEKTPYYCTHFVLTSCQQTKPLLRR